MYEVFEHTADLGLRILAATQKDLFAEAGRGISSLLVANLLQVRQVQQRTLKVTGEQTDYLLFDWLNELLYLFETERFVGSGFEVRFVADGLEGICRGERLDPARHGTGHEVKAITYHGLSVQCREGTWKAELIVDI